MADQAQVLRIVRMLEEIQRTKPNAYELIVKALDYPDDEFTEFLIETLPKFRHSLN